MAIQRAQQVSNQRVSALKVDSTLAALVVHNVDASGAYVSPGAGSTQVSVKEILTAGGQSVIDSSNNSIGVTIRAGSAAGTEYTDGDVDATVSGGALLFDNSSNTLRSVTIARGLPVNVVGGTISASTIVTISTGSVTADTELPAAAALADNTANPTAPAVAAFSHLWTGSVWHRAPGNTNGQQMIGAVPVDNANVQSVAPVAIGGRASAAAPTDVSADNDAQIFWVLRNGAQATVLTAAGALIGGDAANGLDVDITRGTVRSTNGVAADLQATVTPVAGSTFNTRPLQSSAADLQMTATPAAGSTWKVALYTSSGGAVEGSTTTQSTGSVLGINTREVQPSGRQSTSILVRVDSAGASTTLISSVAGLRHCVFAYSVMSTIIAISSCAFLSSLGTAERWGLLLGTGSSGITGANLAINPPGFLFQTNTADPLGFSASSSGLYRVSISWFTEA